MAQLDNGALQGTITSSQQNSTANVEIGGRPNTTSFQFTGRIDDVRIADHALTQDQIQSEMMTTLVGARPTISRRRCRLLPHPRIQRSPEP